MAGRNAQCPVSSSPSSAPLGYLTANGGIPLLGAAEVNELPRWAEKAPAGPRPGSPAGTATIDGRYLPNTPPKFAGEINLNAAQSKPWWLLCVVPPKGSPNVLLIMTERRGLRRPEHFRRRLTPPRCSTASPKWAYATPTFIPPRWCSPDAGRSSSPAATTTPSAMASSRKCQPATRATTASSVPSAQPSPAHPPGQRLRHLLFGKNHNTPDFTASQAGPLRPVAGRHGL